MSVNNEINLNRELITQKLNECDFDWCTELLKEEFKLKRNHENVVTINAPSEQTVVILGEILSNLCPTISDSNNNEKQLLLVKQCFQSLRNCSTCGETTQNLIVNNLIVVEESCIILKKILFEKFDALSVDCLKMEMQFLCNVIISNKYAQIKIWEEFSELFKISLSRKEIAHIVTMIIYNILREHENLIPKDIEFVSVLTLLCSENIDNVPLLLELLITKNAITNIYNDLDAELRLTLLENIYTIMIEDILLPYELIEILVDNFKKKSDCILKTVTDYLRNIEPLEVARLLDCISSASSKEIFLPKLQEDKSLFINCAFLLKSIHDAGKSGDNKFSSIQKLSEINNADTSVQEHPGFGFKAGLIRLLGNMCWKHKDNQNLIRELDCIPLLMDSCNIDARNPLIIQWVILAIRNLSENNVENQSVIAQMTKVGVVDSALVREMGLTLHNDGNSNIGIVPLDLKK